MHISSGQVLDKMSKQTIFFGFSDFIFTNPRRCVKILTNEKSFLDK